MKRTSRRSFGSREAGCCERFHTATNCPGSSVKNRVHLDVRVGTGLR
ncbi:hypothetical protein [Streptomyces tendae]